MIYYELNSIIRTSKRFDGYDKHPPSEVYFVSILIKYTMIMICDDDKHL